MSRNDRTSVTLSCILVTLTLFSLTASTALAAPWCQDAIDLEPNAVWHGAGPMEEQVFHWHLPAAGVATVDVSSADFDPVRIDPARIDVRSGACGEPAVDVLVIERSATHLVLATPTAATFHIRAATDVSRFKLVTSFIEAEIVEEVFELGVSGMRAVETSFLADGLVRKADPEKVDPDPDGLIDGRHLLASFLTLRPTPPPLSPSGGTFPLSPSGGTFPLSPSEGTFPLSPSGGTFPLSPSGGTLSNKADPEKVDPDPDGLTVHGTDPAACRVLLYW